MAKYTVFVGGAEVNDYLLSEAQAEALVQAYREDGYDDAHKVQIDDNYLRLAWAIVKCDHVFIQDGKCTRCEKELG